MEKNNVRSLDIRKKYWDSFYATHNIINPTPFAVFCSNYLKKNSTLCDLGCGNGRDSIFFSEICNKVIAIDYSPKAIEQIMSYNKKNIDAICTNMAQLNLKNIDAIYSRFSIHSITEEEENEVMAWIKKSINPGGMFFIEARSDKNKNEKFYIKEAHYRRFINLNEIKNKIQKIGFQIDYCKEDIGLAKFKTEDPLIIRIIARKL